MAGLIFTSFKNFITSNFDGIVWLNVKKLAQLNFDEDDINQSFDDQMGILMVNTLSTLVNIPSNTLLNQMGVFFVQKTIQEKYGNIIFAGGLSLEEFINNLPKFHSKMLSLLQNTDPPDLVVERIEAKKFLLHYYSNRTGMIEFLIGILEGIAQIFKTPIALKIQDNQTLHKQHDIIEILILQ
jgi:hypothetical protein